MRRREFLGSATGLGVMAALPTMDSREVSASELPSDLTDMSASTLSAAIKQRHVTCREVMLAYLERTHRYNPVYNAIVSLRDDESLIAAAVQADKELDAGQYRGWLHGMPMAVKDLNPVKGIRTTNGSPIFADQIPDHDGLMVRRMRADGAIFVGKTNVPEFGMGSQSYNPIFGATGSAYDPTLTAGGSSGGAACALATRMMPVADGSDMMGSLRNPGAYNNVIGLRPTQGRVPYDGSDLFYQQLGIGGPMGRNAEDTARLLGTLAGRDPGVPLSQSDDMPVAEKYTPKQIDKLKIGWLGNYNGHLEMEPDILDLCEQSLNVLAEHGAIVEPCKPDYDMDRLWDTWLTLRHWARHSMFSLYEDSETRALLKPEAVWEIEGAFNTSAADIFAAGVARSDWFRALRSLFDSYDFLVVPTAQVFPFSKEIHWPKKINKRKMDTYHRWMEVVIGGTLAGLPVANVPVGFDAKGRPMGMQVMGPFGQDQDVLEFAMAYESATDYLQIRPTMVEKT